MKKFDGLLDEKMDIQETLENSQKRFEELKLQIQSEDLLIKDLRAHLDKQGKIVEAVQHQVEEEKKVNRKEEER